MTPTTDQPQERIRLNAGQVHLATSNDNRRRYTVTMMKSGLTLNGWVMPPEVLGAAINKFSGAPCQVDHHWWSTLEKYAGTYETPYFEDDAAKATLRLDDTPAGNLLERIFDAWLADKEASLEIAPIGLSAVLWLSFRYNDETEQWAVKEIKEVESVDAVLHPAAGGEVERVLNSIQQQGVGIPGANPERSNTMPKKEETTSATGDDVQESTPLQDKPISQTDALATIQRISEQVERLTASATKAETESTITERIETLSTQVERLTAVAAETEAENTVQGMGTAPRDALQVSLGRGSLERIQLAVDALVAGTRPADDIAPLTGIRELYHLLSGDYEMSGVFNAERVSLANVTSSTMAKLTADALNKAVMISFQTYPRWWEKIVTPMDFSSLQDVKWITLGGVGELPTVNEGAAYTEMTWDDIEQKDSFVKKGGYLGLTLEAIDKDDTRRLQAAPRAIAQASWLTLSKSISAIFTANSGVGPNIYYDDSNTRALFHASNSNLGTTALSHAAWIATRLAMRKQAEHHSAERLGALTAAKYCLVPPDLETTGIQALATAQVPGSGDWNINPEAIGEGREQRLASARERVIVIDLWTNTANWAAIADPMLYPSIGLGFRYGRTPEIFSVASPTAGLMFTHDTMPIKARFFYATGPIDWRGMYKHNI